VRHADAPQSADHVERLDQRVDRRPLVVEPADGKLEDRESELSRDEKDFDIEAEPVDHRAPEHLLGRVGAEGLETALRILDAGDRQRLHHQVEDLPHRLAVPRLVHLHVGAVDRPTADGDVVAPKVMQRVVDLIDRRRQIGIGEDAVSAGRLEHAAAYGGPLAEIIPQTDQAHAPVGEALDDPRRLVARAVVDDDHLPGIGARAHIIDHRLKRRLDTMSFVICRDD
jgi:hypothetical protein